MLSKITRVRSFTTNAAGMISTDLDSDWIFAFVNFSTNVSFASLPLFLPTIISDLGNFNDLTSNGLSAPPYLLCFFVIIATAWLSDRYRVRGPFACFFASVACVGYLVLALTSDVAPRYFGLFLVVLIFTTVAIVLVRNRWAKGYLQRQTRGSHVLSQMLALSP